VARSFRIRVSSGRREARSAFTAGVNYRPIVQLANGSTRPSAIVIGAALRTGDPNVGKAGILYNVGKIEGFDLFVGASAMGAGNNLSEVKLGGLADVVAEFDMGNPAFSVRLGGGWLSGSKYPIYASFGARTP
jgi:hypothetical protein